MDPNPPRSESPSTTTLRLWFDDEPEAPTPSAAGREPGGPGRVDRQWLVVALSKHEAAITRTIDRGNRERAWWRAFSGR